VAKHCKGDHRNFSRSGRGLQQKEVNTTGHTDWEISTRQGSAADTGRGVQTKLYLQQEQGHSWAVNERKRGDIKSDNTGGEKSFLTKTLFKLTEAPGEDLWGELRRSVGQIWGGFVVFTKFDMGRKSGLSKKLGYAKKGNFWVNRR